MLISIKSIFVQAAAAGTDWLPGTVVSMPIQVQPLIGADFRHFVWASFIVPDRYRRLTFRNVSPANPGRKLKSRAHALFVLPGRTRPVPKE